MAALAHRTEAVPRSLDDVPVALYVTDRQGVITYCNKACIDFAGRVPVTNRDRWCVTWKLFTDDGDPLPHEQCPMAIAIRERRPVRGVTAVAQRPDGSRVNFQPYPTPLFDEAGEFTGAVNLLVDVTAARQRDHWLGEARRCRRLARSMDDGPTIETLERLALEYEAKAGGRG